MIPQIPTDICVKSTKLTNSAVSTELLNAGINTVAIHPGLTEGHAVLLNVELGNSNADFMFCTVKYE